MKENSIEEDMKILEGIIKGDEDCINAIYSQMKVKNDNDEDIQYYKKEIQSIKNIVDNYLKEKARADKLEKEYSAMLTELDENECDYKRVLKENEELKDTNCLVKRYFKLKDTNTYLRKENEELKRLHIQDNKHLDFIMEHSIPVQKVKDKIEELNSRIEKYREYVEQGIETDVEWVDNVADRETVKVLQELLEGRK